MWLTEKKIHHAIVALLLLPGLSAACLASDYPTRTVTIISPYPPGGSADLSARLLAQELGVRLHQSFIVENVAGAGGMIGTRQAGRAQPDGYTLLSTNSGNITINPWLYRKADFDTLKLFAPIAMIGVSDLVLVAANSTSYKTFADVLMAIRNDQARVTCAHAGIGTINHLTMSKFTSSARGKCLEVPYRGAGPALNDIIAGHSQLYFATVPSVVNAISGGLLRAIASTGTARSTLLPDVPTVAESGLKDFESSYWLGITAPAATPATVIEKLAGAVGEMLADAKIKAKLRSMGIEPRFLATSDFAKFLVQDLERWRVIVSEVGVTLDQ